MKDQEARDWLGEEAPQIEAKPVKNAQINTAGKVEIPLPEAKSRASLIVSYILWGLCCILPLIYFIMTVLALLDPSNTYIAFITGLESPDWFLAIICYVFATPVIWIIGLVLAIVDGVKYRIPERKRMSTIVGIVAALICVGGFPASIILHGIHNDKVADMYIAAAKAINAANPEDNSIITKDMLLKIDTGIELSPDHTSYATLSDDPYGDRFIDFCFTLSNGSEVQASLKQIDIKKGERYDFFNASKGNSLTRCNYEELLEGSIFYDAFVRTQIRKEAERQNYTYIPCDNYSAGTQFWACEPRYNNRFDERPGFIERDGVFYTYGVSIDDAGLHLTNITAISRPGDEPEISKIPQNLDKDIYN